LLAIPFEKADFSNDPCGLGGCPTGVDEGPFRVKPGSGDGGLAELPDGLEMSEQHLEVFERQSRTSGDAPGNPI
jgi:hypothetical protein